MFTEFKCMREKSSEKSVYMCDLEKEEKHCVTEREKSKLSVCEREIKRKERKGKYVCIHSYVRVMMKMI